VSDLLQSELQGRVLRLVMNRPEKRNALSASLCRDLADTIGRADRDPRIGAVILAANGLCFSAGMDLEEVGHVSSEQVSLVHEQLFTLASRLSKPLIGEVGGAALGGGTGLVANCHVVIASPQARFGLTEIRLGLWPFLVFRSMSVAVGERRSIELALTGRIFGAEEARTMGLVHEIAENLPARAMETAQAMAESSPTAVRSGLSFVQEARGKDWEMAGLIARRVRDEIFASPDFQEGVHAFHEKRKPDWPSLREKDEYPGERTL
jgi:enoyl-CoA hydratase/carnithine racemase